MAEWKDVIHQLVRICKRQDGDCGICVLSAEACPNSLRFDTSDEAGFVRLEKTVMSWAKENPEPVYETWYEYLEKQHVVAAANSGQFENIHFNDIVVPTLEMFKPIPAPIAEKLGLEPKEGA